MSINFLTMYFYGMIFSSSITLITTISIHLKDKKYKKNLNNFYLNKLSIILIPIE